MFTPPSSAPKQKISVLAVAISVALLLIVSPTLIFMDEGHCTNG